MQAGRSTSRKMPIVAETSSKKYSGGWKKKAGSTFLQRAGIFVFALQSFMEIKAPRLRPRCQRETPMTSPIHAASSSSHLTCTQSSHPTTKRDAPSYHPSSRAFYGPSKDNELPE